MRIEIWTDIICPWCGLGGHRLDQALASFAHADAVTLVHRSFQLDERAPEGTTQSVRQMLRDRKGVPDVQIDRMTRHIEGLAAAEGLAPYQVLENQVGNTSLAHELAAWATEQGQGDAAWAALYRAYFGEARSIFTVDALVDLAVEVGLDPDAARAVLTDRRYRDAVRADGHEARALGATGVPFIVVDRRYAVAGAQPVELLLEMLDAAWRDRPVEAPEADGACGPEGCAPPA